jgi:hypothetical protein
MTVASFDVQAWFIDWWREAPPFYNAYSAGELAAREAVKAYQQHLKTQSETGGVECTTKNP